MAANPFGLVVGSINAVGEVRDSGYQLAYRRAITNF
jgi:hypothetical protein